MDTDLRLPLEWNLPLSGAVTQSFGGQFGLLNINLGSSGDTALEQQMLRKVGSYGRQLGRLCEVVERLLDAVEKSGQLDSEAPEIKDFRLMAAAIRHAKSGHKKA